MGTHNVKCKLRLLFWFSLAGRLSMKCTIEAALVLAMILVCKGNAAEISKFCFIIIVYLLLAISFLLP